MEQNDHPDHHGMIKTVEVDKVITNVNLKLMDDKRVDHLLFASEKEDMSEKEKTYLESYRMKYLIS